MKEKAREHDNPRNIAQTSGYGKDRTAFTFLAGDPFFQLQAVALALLRVVRLAAGFLVRLGVVVGAAEAGCMGAGAEPSGAVASAKKITLPFRGAGASLQTFIFLDFEHPT